MKAKHIYDFALRILGELPDIGTDDDYAERAPYLIASFCGGTAHIDRDYRESHGIEAQPPFNEVFIPLDEDFPFCRRFADAAALYLAAMLIVEENESLSDRIFNRYCDAISTAVHEIPGTRGKILNAYPDN